MPPDHKTCATLRNHCTGIRASNQIPTPAHVFNLINIAKELCWHIPRDQV
ncbi:hypothetical protein TRIP_C60053 [Candidatus Zixiibacteriota bacterium]|nr:hypothetical protein TRIP_C60053 [candidate division Zixibacteria bacterium]